MCDKNPDCLNSKILVLNTNFLAQINRAVKQEIASYVLGKPLNEQGIFFLEKIQDIFNSIRHCGDDLIFTSDKVFNDEIDVTKLGSALRREDMSFFDRLCMENEFIISLSSTYQNIINIEPMEEEEVEIFRRLLSEDIGYADISLILLAIKFSQDSEVIIITDDIALRNAIKNLNKARVVAIRGENLSTEHLYYMCSLHFLRNLHSCCEMSNSLWMSTVWSFVQHQQKRYDEGKISEEIYNEHNQYVGPCLAQLRIDCDAKKKREEIEQFSKMFGVNDEGQN